MTPTAAEASTLSRGRIHASGSVAVAAAILIVLAGCETLSLGQDEPDEIVALPVVQPVAPGTLALAERALSDDRYDDARQLIERVLISEPENWEAQLLLAEMHLASGYPGIAEPVFESLIEKAEVTERALQGYGISLTLQDKLDDGVDSLLQAVAQDPSLWRAWNALGFYHDSNQDWAAAGDSYGKAIEENPDSALIYNNRGYSLLMQKRLEAAVADFNRALRLDPKFEVARENLRLALAWQGKYVHAIAGASNRDLARILNNVGFIALMRGDYGNAEAYLLRAMEADPRYNETAARNLNYLDQVREMAKGQSESIAN